jgi:hypothetical protein
VPAQHVVGTRTDLPIARKFATTSMRKSLNEGAEEHDSHRATGVGVQHVRPVDGEPKSTRSAGLWAAIEVEVLGLELPSLFEGVMRLRLRWPVLEVRQC